MVTSVSRLQGRRLFGTLVLIMVDNTSHFCQLLCTRGMHCCVREEVEGWGHTLLLALFICCKNLSVIEVVCTAR